MIKIMLLTLGIMAFFNMSDPNATAILYIFACLVIIIANRNIINVASLGITLMIVKIFEIIVFNLFWESFNAYGLYITYILMDGLLVLLIFLRVPLVRGFLLRQNKTMDEGQFFVTQADLYLSTVQMLQMFIGFIMLFEHLIRNWEDIFLPQFFALFMHEESIAAISSWLKECLFFYNNFEYLAISTFALEFIVIMNISTVYLQQKRMIRT